MALVKQRGGLKNSNEYGSDTDNQNAEDNDRDDGASDKRHLSNKFVKEAVKCPFCSESFLSKSVLLAHIVSVHSSRKRKQYVCDFCSKIFSSWSNLNRHRRVHTGEKPYGCTTCDKRFSDGSHLKGHLSTHSNNKPFGCELCSNSYKRADGLRNHMTDHTGEMAYACILCNERFKRSGTLRLHVQTRHSGAVNCSTCKIPFAATKYLKRHEKRVHGNRKAFGCNLCDDNKSFYQNYELFKHLRRHIKERPYICENCGYEFSVGNDLTIHKTGCVPDRVRNEVGFPSF